MSLRINTNVQSLAAQRALGINSQNQARNLEHMASGSRINRAADDAAGLAISEKMRGQIRSIRQDVRNANDGISMIQTAEGAMNEVGNILIRFRELSVQAASDTVGDVERGFIEKEVQQMRQEIDRIAAATEFNSKKLLNGEGGVLEIQVGTGNNPDYDRFYFDSGKMNVTAGALGVDGVSVATKEQARENLAKVDTALETLTGNRAELGALQNRFQSSIANLKVYEENLSGARSQIFDVDVASETSELTKNNILSQATISVLSQANMNTMSALKLIG